MLIAVPHGLIAVSWTVVGVTAASFLVLQYAVVERVVGIPLLETLRDAVPALCAGLVLLATTWLGVELLDPALPDLLVMLLPGTRRGGGLRARPPRPVRGHLARPDGARRQPAAAVGLICATARARSSVGERSLHTREVAGSKPAAPIV